MTRLIVMAALLAPALAAADPATDVQRAVIERDRQSAEFAQPALRDMHARRDQMHLPPRLDERAAQARERDAYLLQQPVPVAPAADYPPLPLPGGPRHGVDPIPVQGPDG